MKKTLLAIAVGATFLAPMAASAAPKVYGKFNFGLKNTKMEIGNPGADAIWKLIDNSNSSRLGVKGSEDLGIGGLSAFYQLEYGIDQFRDEGKPFSERNIFAGVKGDFGAVRFGGFDTSVKDIGVDQFNDQDLADFASIIAGETRNSNLIQYTSPKLGGMFTFELTAQPGEGRQKVSDSTAGKMDKGVADTYYAAVKLDLGMAKLNVAYAGNETSGLKADPSGSGMGIDIIRVTGQLMPVQDVVIGALYQQAKEVDDDATALDESKFKDTSWLVNAGYTIEAWKLKAQYGRTEGDQSDEKLTETAVGVDYKLSKSFTTQFNYVQVKQDSTDDKNSQYGAAIVYKF